jgi:PAS domain S-box-containing protein
MSPQRELDALLRAMAQIRVGFQVIDFDWRYVYVNAAAAAHGRRTVADLEGRTMMELYPGIEQTEMFGVLRRCMEERVSDEFDNLFSFPDGRSRWFEIRVDPVPEGICVYSVDIHERRLWQLEVEGRAAALGMSPPPQRSWRAFVSEIGLDGESKPEDVA